MALKVAVLMGGMSAEREISIVTGRAIAGALRELGHEVLEMDAGRELPLELAREAPDAAFMALHGRGGEDGTVQGLLEIMRIPYTGCSVLASAATMDKVFTKRILSSHRIRVADDVVVNRGDSIGDATEEIKRRLSYPVIVKPASEGSSIGVSEVKSEAELAGALDLVFGCDGTALVEKFITGRQLTVGLIGSGPQVLPVVEISTPEGFYDFRAKYESDRTVYTVPASLDTGISDEVQRFALDSFNALGCEGVARVDIILEQGTGALFVLEINTIPGMTATSLLPKAAAVAGIGFNDVVSLILDGARLKVELPG